MVKENCQIISERKACKLFAVNRSSYRYQAVTREEQDALGKALKKLAFKHQACGYRMLYHMLRREGWAINHKRIYRLYREMQLSIRRKVSKKRYHGPRSKLQEAKKRHDFWSLDFVHDRLENGRQVRILVLIDQYSRECLLSLASYSFCGAKVCEELLKLIDYYGPPNLIISDNGSEFRSK